MKTGEIRLEKKVPDGLMQVSFWTGRKLVVNEGHYEWKPQYCIDELFINRTQPYTRWERTTYRYEDRDAANAQFKDYLRRGYEAYRITEEDVRRSDEFARMYAD